MPTKFSQLLADMTPADRAEGRRRADRILAEMPLQELRKARKLSQDSLASALGASQPQISRIEHRTDLYVSTIRRYIEAMGGQLDIVAHFPEGSVRIDQFHTVDLKELDLGKFSSVMVTAGDEEAGGGSVELTRVVVNEPAKWVIGPFPTRSAVDSTQDQECDPELVETAV